MDKTNINALVQSIERSLHLIYKNLFSIKQYQFPPKRITPYFATACSSTAAAIHLPQTARSHGGARQGVEGVPPSVRPTRTKLDYDHGNITYQMFFSEAAGVMNTVSVFRGFSGTGEEKIDPDKSQARLPAAVRENEPALIPRKKEDQRLDPGDGGNRAQISRWAGTLSYPKTTQIWPFPLHTYTTYASQLDIVEKDLSCLKATPKADISSPEI